MGAGDSRLFAISNYNTFYQAPTNDSRSGIHSGSRPPDAQLSNFSNETCQTAKQRNDPVKPCEINLAVCHQPRRLERVTLKVSQNHSFGTLEITDIRTS